MRSLHTVLLLTVLSGFLALQTGHALLYHVAYLLAAVTLLSALWARLGIRGLRLERQTQTPHAQVGQLAEERFVVHNASRLPKLWLEVRDHSDLPDHQASFVISRLGPGERYTWLVKTLCQRRGHFTLGPITLVSSDPLGLFKITRHLETTFPILVTPAALGLGSFQPEAGPMGGGDAVRGRAHEITANVATVRDYSPGDALKRIHWPSTARKSRILVKEFELDPTAEIWLFLDLGRHTWAGSIEPAPVPIDPPLFRSQPYVWEPIPNTEEYGVILAASLARYYMQRSRAVGLVAYGPHREFLKPAHGHHQLERILELLALARSQGDIPLSRILEDQGSRLGRNGMACVITSARDSDWIAAARRLTRRGPAVVIFFIDPSSFSPVADMTGVFASLQASRLPAFTLGRGDIKSGQVMLSAIREQIA